MKRMRINMKQLPQTCPNSISLNTCGRVMKMSDGPVSNEMS